MTAVRDRIDAIRGVAAHFGRELGEAKIVGSFPVTELVIPWRPTGQIKMSEERLPLWTDELKGPGGGRLHPEVVANLATSDLEEPDES